MIGQLGTDALAGSGIGSFLFYVLFVGFIGCSSSVHTMVARYRAQPTRFMLNFTYIGLSIGLLLSILITIATMHYSYFLVSLFSKEQSPGIGNDYLSYRIIGLPFFSICLVTVGLEWI